MSAAMPAKKYLKGFQSCTKVTSHLARVVVGQRPDMVYRPPPAGERTRFGKPA